MARVEKVQHEGREYEIKVETGDFGVRVQTFLDGQAVSPTYTATCEVATDFKMTGWNNVADALAGVAKDDLLNGRL
jgi:hypothetical protein